MEIKKLAKLPYGQAFVEIDENNYYLWSYRTLVAKIEKNVLTVNGLYSATTRKHISAFMSEYTDFDYYTAKACYEMGHSLDLSTGEVFPHKDENK